MKIKKRMSLLVVINDDSLRLLCVKVAKARYIQRLTGAHGVHAGGKAKGENLLHLDVVGNWLVKVLNALGVSLRGYTIG
jgi:hypothetical protein